MKLTLTKCEHMVDWYVIERADHDGREWMEKTGPNSMALRCSSRFSDADVEGSSAEMLVIAATIEAQGECRFKRCAVNAILDEVEFWSPRNSHERGSVGREEANELARLIRATVGT